MSKESLKYHQPTLDLIGKDAVFSTTKIRLLEELEHIAGITLPASVREWYSLANGDQILADYSNTDHAITIEESGKFGTYWQVFETHDYSFLLEQNLLIVLIENQSVWSWAVRLDGGDDPAVVTCAGPPEPQSEWQLCAESFSIFVYTRVWDFKDSLGDYYLWSFYELQPTHLEFLTTYFAQGPKTFSYGCSNLRFYRDTQGLLLFVNQYQTQWDIWAADYMDLVDLLRLLWKCDNLASTLEAVEDTPASSILELLRNEVA